MEPPKISFSFTKSFKKSNIILNASTPKENDKKGEVIEYLEEQSIKIKDTVIEEAHPLVIPLKDDQKNLLDRIKAARKWDKKKEKEDTRPDSELTAEELAARQLLKEAKARLENGHESNDHKVSVLPLTEEPPSLTGEKEPTLEDYESVPIGDYGLALLRGMGWKDGMPIGKNVTKSAALSIPELRPKGLGLGATKVELSGKKATDKDGNELILQKRGFAKAVMGPQNGNYCEIQGFDEEAGRVIVKVYPKGDIININEVMLVPVTKEEFSKGSKIINNAKYEKYKNLSDKKLESLRVKNEKLDSEDSDGLCKAATSSKYSKRSPSSERESNTSKYSHIRRQSRSRSKDKESKKSRSNQGSYLDMDQSKKGTNYTNRSNQRLESDRTESRSRSKDRKSRKNYRSKSRSLSKDKRKDEEERTSRTRFIKDRQRSRSVSEDSYQESEKSRSRSNKDKKKSVNDASDEDKRESRSRSKKSRNKSRDKIRDHSSRHKSSKNCSGSIEKTYSKGKKKKKSSKSKKDRHSSEDSDRSRSTSKDKHLKNRKSRETSYSSDSDLKKEKRRKNKCKSRHRQSSSSDSEDRKYRKKK